MERAELVIALGVIAGTVVLVAFIGAVLELLVSSRKDK